MAGDPYDYDPDQWVEPIKAGKATDRLGALLRRFGGRAHPDIDTTKVHVRAPKRGAVEGQIEMFDLEAGGDEQP